MLLNKLFGAILNPKTNWPYGRGPKLPREFWKTGFSRNLFTRLRQEGKTNINQLSRNKSF